MTGCATNIGKQEEILEAYVTENPTMVVVTVQGAPRLP